MHEISRLNGDSDPIELDIVEREATSIEIMEFAHPSTPRRIIALKYCFYS